MASQSTPNTTTRNGGREEEISNVDLNIPMEAQSRVSRRKQCIVCGCNVETKAFCRSKCLQTYRDRSIPFGVYEYRKPNASNTNDEPRARKVKGNHGDGKIYHCMKVSYDKGKYKRRKINPQAWRAFGLSWSDYIDQLVLPLASESDKALLNTLKTGTVPKREYDLTKIFSKGTVSHRLYYLLFNVIRNCIHLHITFPEHVCILDNNEGFICQSYREETQKAATDLFYSPSLERIARQKTRRRKREDSATKSQPNQLKRRKQRLHYDVQKSNEDSYTREYLQWEADLKTKYKWTRGFIDRHTVLWNPNWEKLVNTPGLGCSGTPDMESSFTIHKYFQEIAIANDAIDINIGDVGASCQDMMRNNRITFPHASCYGFEMTNLKQYGMSNAEATQRAWEELDRMLSIANKSLISTAPVDCAYNVMVNNESAALSYPDFLSTRCSAGRKCTKDRNFYMQGRGEETHYCHTCGFNEYDQKAFYSGTSLHFLTFFAKTWTEDDKDSIFKMVGPASSTVDVIFIGDEPGNHDSGFIEELLNRRIKSRRNRWKLVRKNFKVALKGGGTTFQGFIYAREYLKTDITTVHKKISEFVAKEKNQIGFCNNPDYEASPLLDLFTKLLTKDCLKTRRSVQWEMVKRGFWKYVALPDPASCASWVKQQSTTLNVDVVDILRNCLMSHCSTFRELYSFREQGIYNNGIYARSVLIDVDAICHDLHVLLEYAGEKEIIYSKDEMFCINCGLEGDKATVCGHLENNMICRSDHIEFKRKTTVAALQARFEQAVLAHAEERQRITQKYRTLGESFKHRATVNRHTGTDRGFFREHKNFIRSLDVDNITEKDKMHLLVLKVIDVFSNSYCNMTDEQAEREYLHRIKYNLTTANFQLYQRWNRAFKSQRTVQNRWVFELDGRTYSVPVPTIDTTDDREKRIRLLQKAYCDGMPRSKVINCGDHVDAVIADSFERVCTYRLKTILRNTIRAARFNRHKGVLLIGKKFDGAPFNKSGADRSQTVTLAHITNEHFPVTIETLLLCGIINSGEDTVYTKKMCKQLDESMSAFQKMVAARADSDEPYRINGIRFNSVEICLTLDLKAANKTLGAGGHASTFWGITHAGVTTDACGFGKRHLKERELFKDYHRPPSDPTPKTWKKGDKPIFLQHDHRKALRKEIEEVMKAHGYGLPTDHRYRKSGRSKWEKIAMKQANLRGHSFVYEEYFPKTVFASVCFCALHFKTVKALDILYLMMLSMTTYDRYNGHIEAVGPALNHFIESLDHPLFKSQLSSFARDARKLWLGLKLKKGLCHSGKDLKTLNSLLEKSDAKLNIRLLGRQANVVFKHLDTFEEIMNTSVTKCARNKQMAKKVNNKKTAAILEQEMEVVISSIMAYALALRNLVVWVSRSGLESYNCGGTHEDYIAGVKNAVTEMCKAAKIVEMIQSCLFPQLLRPYDVSVCFCLVDVAHFLMRYDVLQGYEGLLEQSEKYHSWLHSMPAFKLSRSFKTQESRNVYRFGRAWLVNCYFYSQPYGLLKETRKKSAQSHSNIIPQDDFPYFNDREKCPCGKELLPTNCAWCSKGKKNEIFRLAQETVALLGSTLSRRTREIWEQWKRLRKSQFIQGLRVAYVV